MDALIEHAPCGFLSFSADGAISRINATLLRLVGYGRDDLLGRHINILLQPAGRIFFQTHLFPLLRLHGHVDELYLALRARDGVDLPVLLNAARRDEGADDYLCVVLPMRQRSRYEAELLQAKRSTEQALREREQAVAELQQTHAELQALNERLTLLATSDPLTGLKNRRAFQERLGAEVAEVRRHGDALSLLLADVDHFKAVNDTYGHPVGDAVLGAIGRLLTRCSRESDLVARFGGEEFALLLPKTDRHGALEVAERLRVAISEARPAEIPVTISIGAATLEEGVDSELDLLLAADQAMYRSKMLGRNRVTHATLLSAAPDLAP